MLDKEQLLKAEKCIKQHNIGCAKCENYENECPYYAEDLIETTLRYRDMLEKLQFLGNTTNIGGAIYKFCPVCGNANIQGHKKDCELAKLLKPKDYLSIDKKQWSDEEIRQQIIKDVTEEDTMSLKEANYDCWKGFLSDARMGLDNEEFYKKYEEYLYENFTEEELEKLWQDSHK